MSAAKPKPKYIEIQTYLTELIKREKLQQGDRLPTEACLCEKFNVSRVTVQGAMRNLEKLGQIYRVRGGGSYIGPMKEDIKEKKFASGYIPFIISDPNPSTRYLEIIKGIEDYLKTKSCYVTVHSPNGNIEEERTIIDSLIENGVKTMIIKPLYSNHNMNYYHGIIRRNINLVFIDILPGGLAGNLVTSNNVLGGYLLTTHLIERGYRNIAILSGPVSSATSVTDRISGHHFALDEHGIAFRPEYEGVVESLGILPRERIEPALEKLFSLPEPPDALFCVNDRTAADSYAVLTKMGLRVPRDIAVVGFDNLPCSQDNPVPITTIDQPFYAIGYEAGRLCWESNKKDHIGYTHRLLPVKLIERESTEPKAPGR